MAPEPGFPERMSTIVRVLSVAALLASAAGADAAVYSPRVLSPHVADTYSMKTFAQFHRWRDLSGDAKVNEVFKYLVDPRTGVYLLVRYIGEPALNNIRIYAHCLEERPRAFAPVLIMHAWSENGVRKTKQVQINGAGEYEIEAATEPVDEFIELAVPGGAPVAAGNSGGGLVAAQAACPPSHKAPLGHEGLL